MGNAGSVRYAIALAAAFGLVGCSDRPKAWRESEIVDLVRTYAPNDGGNAPYQAEADVEQLRIDHDNLSVTVDRLEAELALMRAENDSLRADLDYMESRLR